MPSRQDEAASLLSVVVDHLTSGAADLEAELRRYAYACELAELVSEAEWAWKELNGYASREEVPHYRHTAAVLRWRVGRTASDHRQLEAATHASMYGSPGPDEDFTQVLGRGVQDPANAAASRGFSDPTGEVTTIPHRQYPKPGYEFERAVVVEPRHITATLGRIERALLERVIANRIGLVYGSVVEEIWPKLRSDLEPRLLAMGVTDHLETIEQGLNSGTAAGRQSALYGCRSLLTALTDHLWQDERDTYTLLRGDGVNGKLVVTQDRPKNRLGAYLHQSIGGTSAEDYLQAEIERVWQSISKLVDLTNKAHDADVSQQDAELAVIGTYFLVGELGRRTDFIPVECYTD